MTAARRLMTGKTVLTTGGTGGIARASGIAVSQVITGIVVWRTLEARLAAAATSAATSA